MWWLDQLCKSASSAHSKGPAALTYLCITPCMISQQFTMKTALVAWRKMSLRRSVAVLRHSDGHFVVGVNVWFLLPSEKIMVYGLLLAVACSLYGKCRFLDVRQRNLRCCKWRERLCFWYFLIQALLDRYCISKVSELAAACKYTECSCSTCKPSKAFTYRPLFPWSCS